ncbi:MAG: Asp-tRNA(Asn)/Glu-tRNA(Gln) amidotransferase subunit GatC [Actinobacteria bacterium]|nr:Asp-tRNA(Asn)/Glu-tRNA(Gln) amidotransferase subunit GatC [Actinomycetota bacterium]
MPSNDATPSTERITAADVAKVARLARLRLTDAELERFTHQLSDILDHAGDLDLLDLDGVEPMARPVPLTNVLRPDEPQSSDAALRRDDVLAAAPAAEDGQFRVPPVLGEAP